MVEGVLDTTFKVPIIMKIYMCKIQDEPVIIISKNKSHNDFLTPCTMHQHGGWKLYKKHDVSMDWNCTAYKRSTVKILDTFRICRASWFSRTPNFFGKKSLFTILWIATIICTPQLKVRYPGESAWPADTLLVRIGIWQEKKSVLTKASNRWSTQAAWDKTWCIFGLKLHRL